MAQRRQEVVTQEDVTETPASDPGGLTEEQLEQATEVLDKLTQEDEEGAKLEESEAIGILGRLAKTFGLKVEQEDTELAEDSSGALKAGSKVEFTKNGQTVTGTIKSIDGDTARVEVKDDGSTKLTHQFVKLSSLKPAGSSSKANEKQMGEDGPDEVTLYQLPYDFAEPEKVGKKLWRKHLLPLGKAIEYHGQKLDFSKENLQQMIDTWKEKAFDTVYAAVGHSREADKQRGVLANLFIREKGDGADGLYGDFELSGEGESIIKNSLGQIGTSVSYLPSYTRGADGRKFVNALQHVAFTPTPHVHGLRSGEYIAMSEQVEVVDLTEAEFTAHEPRKESGLPMEDAVNNQETNEEVKMPTADTKVEFSAEAQQAIELAREEARKYREELDGYRELSVKTAKELLEQKVERELDDYRLAGVPPADINLARPVLLSEEATKEITVVELTEGGGAEQKKVSIANQMRKILDNQRGTISMAEVGSSEVEPEQEDKASAFADRVDKYIEQHEGSTRGEAANAIAMEMQAHGEEVIF